MQYVLDTSPPYPTAADNIMNWNRSERVDQDFLVSSVLPPKEASCFRIVSNPAVTEVRNAISRVVNSSSDRKSTRAVTRIGIAYTGRRLRLSRGTGPSRISAASDCTKG